MHVWGTTATYQMKALSCDPAQLPDLSERLIVGHYEHDYGGAVKRLNAITDQLAGIAPGSTPVFVPNGLKREELVAANSMILHEIHFDNLGASRSIDRAPEAAIKRDFGSVDRWRDECRSGRGSPPA